MKKHDGHEDLRSLNHWSVIPHVHGRIGVVLQCVVQALSWLFQSWGWENPLILASAWTFYSSRTGSYNETQDPTGGLRAGKTLCSMTLMTKSSEWCIQRHGHAWSCRLPCCTRLVVWCRAVKSLGTVAVPDEWSIVLTSHCSRTVDACPHVL
jgi:hypothetical protein